MPTEEQIMKMGPNSEKGWILKVDLEYPEELHDWHNDYPLAPEKKVIKPGQMSEYQRRLMAGLHLTMPNTEKLVLTLEDKENYVAHYKNLQFYLRQRMRLKKVHRVIEFDQEPWMEPYIRMNREFRKQAKSDFQIDFLQADEQLGVWQDYGESAKPRGCEDSQSLGKWQDTEAGVKPIFWQIYNFWKRYGRHSHAQNEAGAEQASVHRHDDSREQQDLDVRILLQLLESQIRTEL